MATIKTLMIPCIENQYTQEYIANVFWKQHIAKVSSITLIPYIKNSEIYTTAYINIDTWCDTESAYNFIQRLKTTNSESRLVYQDDNWWPVQLNIHNNGDINVGSYTASFDSSYFEQSNRSTDDKEWLEFVKNHPIKGLRNDYYTTEEALYHLWNLSWKLYQGWDNSIQESSDYLEMLHFENELRIHDTVNNSDNVTVRTSKFRKTDVCDFDYECLAV